MTDSFEKENELLLLCSKTDIDSVDSERISTLVCSELNWKALVNIAYHHKTWPLLYKNLSFVCSDAPPMYILENLKRHYFNNSLWNMQRLQLLQEIADLFNKNDLDFLTVKGPLLTLQGFGDIAYRYFGDLDILVHKEDMEKATDLICSLGFNYFPEGLPESYYYWFAKMNHHGNLDNNKGLHVELHWELSAHYEGLVWTYEEMSPFIETVELLGDFTVKTLNAEMMLLYLSLHGQQHYWQRYDYCSCVFQYLKSIPDDCWGKAVELATRYDIREVLFLARCLTGKLYETNFNPAFIEHEKEFEQCWEQVVIYCKNYSEINKAVQNNEGKRFVEIIPQRVKILGSRWKKGRILQFFRSYLIPKLADWDIIKPPYTFHFLFYLIRPFIHLSEKIIHK